MEISVKQIIIIVLLQLITACMIYRMNDVPWDDSISVK